MTSFVNCQTNVRQTAQTDVLIEGCNRLKYYRGRWPDSDVPPGEPTWSYYEVDTTKDVVLRTVDVFTDGRIERNSIALEERKGDSCPSLVEGPFMNIVLSVPLGLITAAEFEDLWQQGTDTPFWFPDGFPRPSQL
jgi:hypothetical protein